MPERYLGRTLGKYRVDDLLGTGGFAWVFRGFDPELGIPVALKVLKPQFAGDPDFEERFRSEASTAARLRHPNIITIYAVGRGGDAVYFAMDYLPQGLAGRLQVLRTLPPALLVRLGTDIARALGYAHREGVVHRDIKTDNILFDDHGNAVVADFGIARAVAQHAERTGTNLVVGTPQYFAPEQARGRTVDGRSDVYSLGVTLFHAATGRLPFEGSDWYEVARRHVEEPPPAPRSFAPALPRALDAIILRCLEKDPEDRYQTAEELCEALQREAPDLGPEGSARTMAVPSLDRLLSPGVPSIRRRRRRRLLAGMATLLTVTGVGGLLWSTTRAGDVVPGAAAADPPGSNRLGARTPPPADSQGTTGDSAQAAAVAGGARRASPAVLRVTAPPDAQIRVDGRLVRSRQLTFTESGAHRVEAAVRALPGCPSATMERVVRAELGDTVTAQLAPRPCGWLSVETTTSGAEYIIEPRTGGPTTRGRLPLASPVLLPIGEYHLTVRARECYPYTTRDGAPIPVASYALATKSVKLLCGAGEP